MKQFKITVLDFDGTLTTKDTLLEFIKFVKGPVACYWGVFLFLPVILAFKLKLYPNWKAKQHLFSYFFRDMPYEQFAGYGQLFVSEINKMVNVKQFIIARQRIESGEKVIVVTASIEEWVRPWCEQNNIKTVLGTRIEVVDGKLTGRFSSKNCYGPEKVNRLLEIYPDRSLYYLTAYGDSRGDLDMLSLADEPHWVK